MQDHEHEQASGEVLPAHLETLAAALGRLSPAVSGPGDRDRLIFEAGRRAGRAAARRALVAWRLGGVAATVAAGVLGWIAMQGPARVDTVRPISVAGATGVPTEAEPSVPEPAVASIQLSSSAQRPHFGGPDVSASYHRLRRSVLHRGMDGLPSFRPSVGAGEVPASAWPSTQLLPEQQTEHQTRLEINT